MQARRGIVQEVDGNGLPGVGIMTVGHRVIKVELAWMVVRSWTYLVDMCKERDVIDCGERG